MVIVIREEFLDEDQINILTTKFVNPLLEEPNLLHEDNTEIFYNTTQEVEDMVKTLSSNPEVFTNYFNSIQNLIAQGHSEEVVMSNSINILTGQMANYIKDFIRLNTYHKTSKITNFSTDTLQRIIKDIKVKTSTVVDIYKKIREYEENKKKELSTKNNVMN
jgi:hypothetical protein